MKNYLESTIKKYVKELSQRTIAPGGGSAAALTAALGASLNLMVINYSVKGKNAIKSRQEKCLKRLLPLVDKDCKVFKELMRSLSSNKNDIQRRYIAAAKVPLLVSAECGEAIKITGELLGFANKNLMTDVGCAALLLRAAFYSACLNAEVNLKRIEDKVFVKKTRRELKLLQKAFVPFKNLCLYRLKI